MVNRPHCPRDPQLRAFLAELGCEWPEPEPQVEGHESEGDDEYEESEESAGDGEDECVDPDETPSTDQHMKVEMETKNDGGGTPNEVIEAATECTKEGLTGALQKRLQLFTGLCVQSSNT